jgi:putative colanic acid biosynthesis glycosyltransferase
VTPDPSTSLTVITVVFNDLPGLVRTLHSVQRLLPVVEHWVIDGSTNTEVSDHLRSHAGDAIRFLCEPDEGLYDAMNKGLDRAKTAYVLFLNAGDVFQPSFDPRRFLSAAGASPGRVVLGYSIEKNGADEFQRPAAGREADAFHSPAHQATAYPTAVYSRLRFDTALSIKADARFTQAALRLVGGVFVDMTVCEFELGGRSSRYSSLAIFQTRLRDSANARETFLLVVKTVLYALLPTTAFYRLLAWRKYDRIWPDEARTHLRRSGRPMAEIQAARF